jgi:hypothetical protein
MRPYFRPHTTRKYERTRLVVVLTAALALLLAPTAATAAPHRIHTSVPESVFATIHTPASNGFSLELEARRLHFSKAELAKFSDATPATSSTAFMTLKRGPASVDYYAPGATFAGGVLEDHLGGLGEVRLRFEPRRVTHKPAQTGCSDGIRVERGVFVGILRFSGEKGYSRLLRRRVPGTVFREPPLVCDLVPQESRGARSTRVSGSRVRGPKSVGIVAQRLSPSGAAKIYATDSERRGRVSVQRTLEVEGPAGTLSIDDGLTEASLKPPAPFEGEARFQAFEGKRSGTWLGSLAVSFPGDPHVRLAGKVFEGALLPDGQCSVDPNVQCVSF